MNKHFAASAALLMLIGTTAQAADLPPRTQPPLVAPIPVLTWSGVYVGAHAGYGWGDFDFRDPAIAVSAPGLAFPGGGLTLGLPLQRTFDGSSFLGGGQVGVNAQWGALVVGIEGDLSKTGIDGEVRSTGGPFVVPPLGVITTEEGASAELEWLGTVRGRLGFAFDRFLVYGTGGVAFGRVSATGDVTATDGVNTLSLRASDDQTHVGWTAGLGIEGMILPALSAKLEYLYADLGWEKHHGPGIITASPGVAALLPPGTAAEASGDYKLEVHSIKVGLNYRFNLFGP